MNVIMIHFICKIYHMVLLVLYKLISFWYIIDGLMMNTEIILLDLHTF